MKIKNLFTSLFFLVVLYGCSSQDNLTKNTLKNDFSNVLSTVTLSKNTGYFKDQSLVVSLYEYNIMLADSSATLIEKKSFNVSHTEKHSSFPLVVELGKNFSINKQRKYYLTTKIQNSNGDQTYYGYKNGSDGFSSILEHSNKINVVLKAVK